MTVEIIVPPLGESVTEATIAKLLKKQGDYVKADEMLVELETDKVTLEVNAPSSGIIKELKVKEGDSVKVKAIIGVIDDKAVKPAGISSSVSDSKPLKGETVTVRVAETPSSKGASGVLSPAAQKLASENNVNISSGSGKDGRVTKGDVLSAMQSSFVPVNTGPREERVKMTKLRQKIAQRLKDSQNTAASLTTFNEVDMSAVMKLRDIYKEEFQKKYGVKLGFMSFFTKAAVNALKQIPVVNAEIQGDEVIYKNYYDISVAVGTPQGLVVPVVRDADRLSYAGIEMTIAELGKKAREGKLTVQDMTGGTFTISNGGVYGSLMGTPIINPPQTGILGLHKIQERPVVVGGEVKIRPMMYLALTYDHRLIDGAEAVTFLVKIKEAIEDPQRLLLEV